MKAWRRSAGLSGAGGAPAPPASPQEPVDEVDAGPLLNQATWGFLDIADVVGDPGALLVDGRPAQSVVDNGDGSYTATYVNSVDGSSSWQVVAGDTTWLFPGGKVGIAPGSGGVVG